MCKIIYILNFIYGVIFFIVIFIFILFVMVKRVVVIGVGVVGLCVVCYLSVSFDLFSVVCFDMSLIVGGIWNYIDFMGKDEYGFFV